MEKDKDLCRTKDEVTALVKFEVYAESTPQAILQAYTLWKRPIQCFQANTSNCKFNIYSVWDFPRRLTIIFIELKI